MQVRKSCESWNVDIVTVMHMKELFDGKYSGHPNTLARRCEWQLWGAAAWQYSRAQAVKSVERLDLSWVSGRVDAYSLLVLASGQGAVCTFESNANCDVDDTAAVQVLLLQLPLLLRLSAAAITSEGDHHSCSAALPLTRPPTTSTTSRPPTTVGPVSSLSSLHFPTRAFGTGIRYSSVLRRCGGSRVGQDDDDAR